jgi:hypothetical protein
MKKNVDTNWEEHIISFIHRTLGEMLDGEYQRVKIFGEMLDKPESLDSDAYMLSRAYDFTFPKWDNRRLK